MKGSVGVLNVGAGDTKLSFDKNNPAERIRAARIVRDMLRRGYALLVDTGEGKYQRVHDFDEERCEYIIADFAPEETEANTIGVIPRGVRLSEEKERGKAGESEAAHEDAAAGGGAGNSAGQPAAGGARKRGRPRRIPAESTNAVAVARTAGG